MARSRSRNSRHSDTRLPRRPYYQLEEKRTPVRRGGTVGPAGPSGTDGSDGASGLAGADGRSFLWRGEWNILVTYSGDDVVEYSGSSFIATGDPGSSAPGSTSYWELMAQSGAPGSDGATGATGTAGDPGIIWEGAWDEDTIYTEDDAVYYSGDGFTYIVTGGPTSTGVAPSGSVDWDIMLSFGPHRWNHASGGSDQLDHQAMFGAGVNDHSAIDDHLSATGFHISSHGGLQNLTSDDHPQYLLTSGDRPLLGDWDAGNKQATNLGTVMVQSGEPSSPAIGQLWYDTSADFVVLDRLSTTTVTSTYTILNTDNVIFCDGTFTITLPTAVGIPGKPYWIKNIGSGVVTASGDGLETIDTSSTQVLSTHEAITLVSDGTEYWIV